MNERTTKVLRLLVLVVVYVGAAKLGLGLDAVEGFATLVWAPTGISLAALVLFDIGLWPGVFVGAFIVNAWSGAAVPVALGIALGNTLEAVLAAHALRKLSFRPSLDSLRDVALLVSIAALASTIVSATIGTGSLLAGGVVDRATFLPTWRAWWLGDLIGDLVCAPLLLAWCTTGHSSPLGPRRWLEAFALAALTLLGGMFVFAGPAAEILSAFRQPFLLFVPLMWAAMRFGMRGVTAAAVSTSVFAIYGTAKGQGPFVHDVLHDSLAHLQVFMGISSVAVLALCASVEERRRALAAQERDHRLLKVAEEGQRLLADLAPLLARSSDDELPLERISALVVERKLAERCTLEVTDNVRAQRASAGEQAEHERSFALETRGQALGTMTLQSSLPFAPHAVELGQELARRISMAVESAQLYRLACEAIRARDEFLSIASHELRTPLHALVINLSHVCATSARERMNIEDTKSRIARAVHQTDRLTRLVDSLLDVSRVSAGRLYLHCEEVDLTDLSRDVAARFVDQANLHGGSIEVRAAGPVEGSWDRLRMEQVLTNLLSNALKYGAGKPITVSVEAVGSSVRLSVEDRGIGIPEEDQARVFERYQRAASARHYNGLGLGLFIARQIVEAHGGVIAVHSVRHQGTVFSVELPKNAQVHSLDVTSVGAVMHDRKVLRALESES